MKRVQRVKLFTGENADDIETAYNTWMDKKYEERAKVPALSNTPFEMRDPCLTIRNYDGEETFALAIFYQEMLLEPHEMGSDKGQGVGLASAFPSEARSSFRKGK